MNMGMDFFVHRNRMSAALGCRPVSSRLIPIHLRAASLISPSYKFYAPTSGHDDNEVDLFYQQLQEAIDQTRKKDNFLVVTRCFFFFFSFLLNILKMNELPYNEKLCRNNALAFS